MPEFRLISWGDELSVFAFTMAGVGGWDMFDVSRALRERGWQVPAYTFPAARENRSVCRNGFSRELADLLVQDLHAVVEQLTNEPDASTASRPIGFHH
jgi:glutamate decarboxylase